MGPERVDGKPAARPSGQWDAAAEIHVFLALLFIAYVPFSKLIHPSPS